MRGGQSTRGNNRQQRNNNPQWGQQNAAPNQPRNNTEISDIVARVMAELDRQRKWTIIVIYTPIICLRCYSPQNTSYGLSQNFFQ